MKSCPYQSLPVVPEALEGGRHRLVVVGSDKLAASVSGPSRTLAPGSDQLGPQERRNRPGWPVFAPRGGETHGGVFN